MAAGVPAVAADEPIAIAAECGPGWTDFGWAVHDNLIDTVDGAGQAVRLKNRVWVHECLDAGFHQYKREYEFDAFAYDPATLNPYLVNLMEISWRVWVCGSLNSSGLASLSNVSSNTVNTPFILYPDYCGPQADANDHFAGWGFNLWVYANW
jgi:hypothetical protein